jgi:exonuclease III
MMRYSGPRSVTRSIACLSKGWTDAVRALHPGARIYTFWDYFRNAWARNAGFVSTVCSSARQSSTV